MLALVASNLGLGVCGWSSGALGQDRSVPGPRFFAVVEDLYRGDYRDAERGMSGEVRGGIRIGRTQWVDSICSRAMLGEVYYQLGDPQRALAEFDAACELFLSYPNWLIAVRFTDPRPDGNPNRRIAPWGQSTRGPQYATYADTMLVQQGEFITEQQLQRGGALQTPQMWRVNAIEVIRCTALAIRRRNDILGPLGRSDRMSKSLVDALARGDNTQRNHWSTAWTELLLGIAQHGIGESQQALAHLMRGTLIDGRFEHPLTGAALLAQATIALESGNAGAAANLATEASYAAFAYEDLDVLGASIDLGHVAFMAAGNEGVYPPLAIAAAWANRERLDHLSASFLINEAEELAAAGQTNAAASRLNNISSRRRELSVGRLGPRRRRVEGLIAYMNGNLANGDQAAAEAIAQARPQSLRNFRIALANRRVDSGQLSSRIAVDMYATLLRDPTANDWAQQPLETLTNVATSHEPALARWMVAALGREEILTAIDIADRTKRRRFWLAQPVGGRLLAIRHLLEADPNRLPPDAAVERRNLLLRIPEYTELVKQAAEIERELAAEPLTDDSRRVPQQRYVNLKRLANNAKQRETLVRQLVLRRDATDMLLPPPITASEVQPRLQQGQAVVVFHRSGGSMFAFVLTREAYHHWRLPDAAPLAEKVAEMLQAMGHFGPTRTFDAKDLASDAWQPAAKQFGDMLFGESRLDLASTTELIVVPDGILWHVPFNALEPTTGGNQQPIIDRTPLRCVPTVGYAAPDSIALQPVRTTIVAAATGAGADEYLPTQAATELAEVTAGAAVIANPVSAASPLLAGLAQQVVVLSDSELKPSGAYEFAPLPLDRSGGRGALSGWLELPVPGCERLVLGGVRTVAENGLRTRGRGRSTNTAAAGDELFHVSCSLLASGAKTVLISRWRTGGKVHRELLREFVLELPNMPADDAWRRSVALARRTDVDPAQEPRINAFDEADSVATADHPFLWAGYLLVDTGSDPAADE